MNKNLATKADYDNTFKALRRVLFGLFIVIFLLLLGLYFRD